MTLAELRKVAEAATPGERAAEKIDDDHCAGQFIWRAGNKIVGPDEHFTPHKDHALEWASNPGDDEFFATFSPTRVLKLLAVVEEMQGALESAKLHFEAMTVSTEENGAPSSEELIAYVDACNSQCVLALTRAQELLE